MRRWWARWRYDVWARRVERIKQRVAVLLKKSDDAETKAREWQERAHDR